MLNNYFCEIPPRSLFCVLKTGENFNPKQLTKPMLTDDSFTEIFTVDVPVGIFQNVSSNIYSCFCWRIYQLLLKVSSLYKKVQAVWFFEETNRIKESITHCSQKKKQKNIQVFLKIGVPNWKNPRNWNYRWTSRVNTWIAPSVGIFK